MYCQHCSLNKFYVLIISTKQYLHTIIIQIPKKGLPSGISLIKKSSYYLVALITKTTALFKPNLFR